MQVPHLYGYLKMQADSRKIRLFERYHIALNIEESLAAPLKSS